MKKMFEVKKYPMSEYYSVSPTQDSLLNPYYYQLYCRVLKIDTAELIERLQYDGAIVKINRLPGRPITLKINFKSEVSASRFCAELNYLVAEKNGWVKEVK